MVPWFDVEVPACRAWPRCGSKGARAPARKTPAKARSALRKSPRFQGNPAWVSVMHGVYLLDEFGDELGGAGRAVGFNVAVADGLAGQFGDMGGDEVGVGGGVV